MILTQITVTALQNKKGLAFGNQVLGWLVLGREPHINHLSNLSLVVGGSVPSHKVPQSSLPPPPRHNLPRILPYLHHPNNLLRRSFLRSFLHHPGSLVR